jgi:hypothetical protein
MNGVTGEAVITVFGSCEISSLGSFVKGTVFYDF